MKCRSSVALFLVFCTWLALCESTSSQKRKNELVRIDNAVTALLEMQQKLSGLPVANSGLVDGLIKELQFRQNSFNQVIQVNSDSDTHEQDYFSEDEDEDDDNDYFTDDDVIPGAEDCDPSNRSDGELTLYTLPWCGYSRAALRVLRSLCPGSFSSGGRDGISDNDSDSTAARAVCVGGWRLRAPVDCHTARADCDRAGVKLQPSLTMRYRGRVFAYTGPISEHALAATLRALSASDAGGSVVAALNNTVVSVSLSSSCHRDFSVHLAVLLAHEGVVLQAQRGSDGVHAAVKDVDTGAWHPLLSLASCSAGARAASQAIVSALRQRVQLFASRNDMVRLAADGPFIAVFAERNDTATQRLLQHAYAKSDGSLPVFLMDAAEHPTLMLRLTATSRTPAAAWVSVAEGRHGPLSLSAAVTAVLANATADPSLAPQPGQECSSYRGHNIDETESGCAVRDQTAGGIALRVLARSDLLAANSSACPMAVLFTSASCGFSARMQVLVQTARSLFAASAPPVAVFDCGVDASACALVGVSAVPLLRVYRNAPNTWSDLSAAMPSVADIVAFVNSGGRDQGEGAAASGLAQFHRSLSAQLHDVTAVLARGLQ